MNNQGVLVVFSGPSGVGKGTLLGRVLERCPQTVCSVSSTTRKPRPGEVDGVNYHFISKEEFEQLITEGGMLEYAIYNENYYGTPRKFVEENIRMGNNVILEIEVQGAKKVKEVWPESVSVFIMPPSYQSLNERLLGRGTETQDAVNSRLLAAKEELKSAAEYEYIIVNDDLEVASEQLEAVFKAVKCSVKFQKTFIDEVLKNA